MSKARCNLNAAGLLSGAMIGGLILCLHGSAAAQGKRAFTPEGFEFGVTTSSIKYHFSREKQKGTVFKGTWIAENAEEVRPNFEIASAEVKPGPEPAVSFSLGKPKNDWPKGLYRLEIRADGVLVHTVKFMIR